MTNAQEIAATILKQLGGNKFIAMTGSKNFITTSTGNGLAMHLTRNAAKAKYLKIELKSDDTYTMTFTTLKRTKDAELAKHGVTFYNDELVTVKEIDGLYCDQLQSIFTEVTGLYTHL